MPLSDMSVFYEWRCIMAMYGYLPAIFMIVASRMAHINMFAILVYHFYYAQGRRYDPSELSSSYS